MARQQEVCLPVLYFEKPSPDSKHSIAGWWQIAITPVLNSQNAVECLMCVTRNVTEQEQIRQAIEAAKNKEQNLAEALAATNEELAATNEELTATVEEVRQAQEELSAMNESLEERIKERTLKLSQREASLTSLVMTAHYPLMILRGSEWVIEIANSPIANLWQKSLQDILGRRLIDVLPEIKDQPFPQLLKGMFDTGVPYSQEEDILSLHTEQGIVNKYISFYYDPMFDESGEVTAIIVAADDITEKVEARLAIERSHQAEQALNEELTAVNEELAASNEELRVTIEELDETQETLRHTIMGLEESEGRFQNLVRDATVGIIVLTGDALTVAIVNDAYSRLIGRKAAELNRRNLFDVIPEAEAGFRPILDNVRKTGEPLYLNDHPYFCF
jgi:PAS domain-containing protein